MQRFMSYRIVILNGEKRGERLDIGRAPLTLGRGTSCDIQLPDSNIGEIHAQITPKSDELFINVMGENNRLLVNKADVQAASLKHGDVIEIGATRLFIQSQNTSGTWEGLIRFRRWRKWISIGLPILLLTGIALTLNQCRHETTPPVPEAVPRASYTPPVADSNNTDWMVTNIPRIKIRSSVVMSPAPPEVVESELMFLQSRTNNIQQEIDISLQEIEFATKFLEEARKQGAEKPAIPDVTPPDDIIQQAEASLSLTTSVPTEPVGSNTPSEMTVNEAPTNQAESLKN